MLATWALVRGEVGSDSIHPIDFPRLGQRYIVERMFVYRLEDTNQIVALDLCFRKQAYFKPGAPLSRTMLASIDGATWREMEPNIPVLSAKEWLEKRKLAELYYDDAYKLEVEQALGTFPVNVRVWRFGALPGAKHSQIQKETRRAEQVDNDAFFKILSTEVVATDITVVNASECMSLVSFGSSDDLLYNNEVEEDLEKQETRVSLISTPATPPPTTMRMRDDALSLYSMLEGKKTAYGTLDDETSIHSNAHDEQQVPSKLTWRSACGLLVAYLACIWSLFGIVEWISASNLNREGQLGILIVLSVLAFVGSVLFVATSETSSAVFAYCAVAFSACLSATGVHYGDGSFTSRANVVLALTPGYVALLLVRLRQHPQQQ